MGQVKKQYQEWLEHHYPVEVANQVKQELNDAWVEQFESALRQILGNQANNVDKGDKDE